ncbi:hypothetical protein E8E13_004598 [Curvularia kusanoi]|uniref:Uncharacterized protein n=1 Tax=Curvularia kusanoi TaxID=90978 RepID=A0A9P4T7W6_CURKU|nr:hypothetical protein E8E13_004598 [Curvularia kusanoi]
MAHQPTEAEAPVSGEANTKADRDAVVSNDGPHIRPTRSTKRVNYKETEDGDQEDSDMSDHYIDKKLDYSSDEHEDTDDEDMVGYEMDTGLRNISFKDCEEEKEYQKYEGV